MQPAFPDSVLSPGIHAALESLVHGRGKASHVNALMAALSALPLALHERATRELGWWLRGTGRAPARRPWFAFWRRPAAVPAWLRLFDHNGYVREAALQELKGSAPSAFFVVALGCRLNDWVPQIRAAATEALRRTSRYTDPAILAQALIHLLPRSRNWARWGHETRLDVLLDRADVAAIVAATVGTSLVGPQAKILRQALRVSAMDVHLPELLRHARQPAVRALVLRLLAEGRIEWEVGPPNVKQWIDKSMGSFRQVRATMGRPIASPLTLAELVRIGSEDRSAQVRLAAATMLSLNFAAIENGRALAEQLAGDRSRAVSERAAFLLR